MGIRNIEKKMEEERRKKAMGAKMAIEHLDSMLNDIRGLHKQLAKLEKQYSKDFKGNPEAAKKMMAIREELGLPNIAGFYQKKMGAGIAEKLTGKGGFFEQLAIQILEIGRDEGESTGGLMSLASIVLAMKKKYEGIVVTISDITKAIGILKENKLIPNTRTLKSGMLVVEFVDLDLGTDHEAIIELASRNQGVISQEKIIMETRWPLDRLERVMNSLQEKKLTERHTDASGMKFVFRGV